MVEDTLFNLYSKSNIYWMSYMRGDKVGRKLYLWQFFRDYFSQFYQITTNLFNYKGLDKQLVREIERRLFYFGISGVVLHDGKLVAANACPLDPDIYGRPTAFTFTFINGAPDSNGYRRRINEDGVLALNSYEMVPTCLLVEHFALLIAHCDTSVQSYLVNTRIEDVIKAGTEKEAEQARAYLNKIYNGEQAAILDKLEEIEVIRHSGTNSTGREYLEIKDAYLRDFYNIFGVNKIDEKKERMVVPEVNANSSMLRLNLEEMLDMRKKLCDDIYDLWGINCSVEPRVDIDGDSKMEGGKEDVALSDTV